MGISKFSIFAICVALTTTICAEDATKETTPKQKDGWYVDFDAAKAAAKERKLPILVDFSGSDWCHWCKILDKEVFATTTWQEWASKNIITYLADSPKNKSLVSKKQLADNTRLAKKFQVRGYPTVMLMDADEKKLAKLGYERGGAENYISVVKAALNPKPISEGLIDGCYINFKKAQEVAKASGKKIYVVFMSSSKTTPDVTFFLSPEVLTEVNKKYVIVKCDFDKKDFSYKQQNMELVKKAKINSYSVVIFNTDGTALKRSVSKKSDTVAEFMQSLADIEAGKMDSAVFSDTVDKKMDKHGFYVSYKEAVAKSKETKRPILVTFTGSDWCGPCKALEAAVFAKSEWKTWAADNVICLSLDFPRKKALPEELTAQNRALMNHFGVRGFPTVMLIDTEGKVLFTPPRAMSVDAYIKNLEGFLKPAEK